MVILVALDIATYLASVVDRATCGVFFATQVTTLPLIVIKNPNEECQLVTSLAKLESEQVTIWKLHVHGEGGIGVVGEVMKRGEGGRERG